jgi:hypothetical protein
MVVSMIPKQQAFHSWAKKTNFWSTIIKISYIINITICCQNVNISISNETNTKAWNGFQIFQNFADYIVMNFLRCRRNLVAIEITCVKSRYTTTTCV